MKKNVELIKLILLELESRNLADVQKSLSIEGYTEEEVMYQLRLLHRREFIEAIDNSSYRDIYILPGHMTDRGHDLLAKLKDDNIWSKVKKFATENAPGAGLSILLKYLESLIR